ncbi:cytochrome c family protein [Parvularcula marina]|uniref:c-type cytochrome n=1 Tax=Parvularcula marina TaxID=2292771 RepID=UPI0035129153
MNMRFVLLTPLFALILAACGGETEAPSANVMSAGGASAPSMSAQAAEGRVLFGECGICHQVDSAKGHRIGPNLYGVYGSPAARHADFRYSKAMQNSGIVWTEETLDPYLENPAKYVRGGRMAYRGQSDPEKRKALIEYLKTLTDETAGTSNAE